MFNLCSYNIRGLNNKKSYAKDFISSNKFSICAILETHVNSQNADSVAQFICPNFSWIYNYEYHYNGRIWVGFDHSIWKLDVFAKSSQHITCKVTDLANSNWYFVTFVYGSNCAVERRLLWNDILSVRDAIGNSAWTLLGDFNICLGPAESSRGGSWSSAMVDFRECLVAAEIMDLRGSGSRFSWWNSNINAPVFKKLDRCLVNANWLQEFSLSYSCCMARGISDHHPVALSLGLPEERIFKPFQFFQHLINDPQFSTVVSNAWSQPVHGDPWQIFTSKLKLVKVGLRSMNRNHGNVHARVLEAKSALHQFQLNLPDVPSSQQLFSEDSLIKELQEAIAEEEIFLKQKSRICWLKNGDSNNGFFFRSCNKRWNSNKILFLEDSNGNNCNSHSEIAAEAVNYYSDLFGTSNSVAEFPDELVLPQLSPSQQVFLSRPFSAADVFSTVKSMPNNKSPGPDGFSKEFFIAAWEIVGSDFTNAVLYFFQTGFLPRIISATALTLVPKHRNASRIVDFRPIACCNFVYKCVSKMIAYRLRTLIPSLISINQSAFVPKRLIGDNVLLAQSLLRDYHLNSGPARCTMKLDIRKAFDSVNWGFLFTVLHRMGFPVVFITWIKACVQSCMISVKINGSLEGFFKAAAGLRQGDPISPYLFVICMEVFTSILKGTESSPSFKFHWKCKPCSISHLFFADDVLLFCNGDLGSINSLLSAVSKFEEVSGLVMNKDKSLMFFANVHEDVITSSSALSGFQRGSLPIKYLGLPLISTKLSARDCSQIIMRTRDKIDCWTNSCLNHAGRLQLIKTVLFGMQAYWSSHLFLPKHILKTIQSYFVKFLWSGSSTGHKQVKVSWKECCKLISEGGLGIKDLYQWNKASFLYHLWRIINARRTSSLWINWVLSSWIKNMSIWTIKVPAKASWCFKKILLLRPLAIRYVKYYVGNHSQHLFWHDPWLDNKPIIQSFNPQLISILESSSSAMVCDFIDNSSWVFPISNHFWAIDLRLKVFQTPIHDADDLQWNDLNFRDVNVTSIWQSLRPPETPPPWIEAVWHPLGIPKCAFIFWLALKDRLLTKERMASFDMETDLRCCLCANAIENVSHLFGSCIYSSEIISDPAFDLAGDWTCYQNGLFTTGGGSNRVKKQLAYLFLAVSVYYIWKERNDRMHTPGHALSPSSLKLTIKRVIREKLSTSKTFQKAAAKDFSLIMALY